MRRPALATRWWRSTALLAVGGLLAGCGGPDSWAFSSITSTGQGLTVVLVWKDSPLDASRLWIALDRVELVGGPSSAVLLDRREEHDMLALQNGESVSFEATEVPVGTYSTLRLSFAPESAGRNRVEVDGATYPLRFARQGGERLDVPGPFTVSGTEPLRWVLDLNARLSVLETASGWWLDPQVGCTPDDPSRVLRGTVRDSSGLLVAGATVSAQWGGSETASSRTRLDGTFELGPLPQPSYTLVATTPDTLASSSVVVSLPHPASLDLVLASGGAPGGADGVAPSGLVAGVVRIYSGAAFLGQAGVDPATGAFELPPLAPGLYTFVLVDSSGPIETLANQSVVSGISTPLFFSP